mgnify:CR=1 FL=1
MSTSFAEKILTNCHICCIIVTTPYPFKGGYDMKTKNHTPRRALALALEFKMGAEIIKTVIIHNLEELAILGAVVIIRALLAFIIHWEIRTEKKEEKMAKTFDAIVVGSGHAGCEAALSLARLNNKTLLNFFFISFNFMGCYLGRKFNNIF